MDAVYRPAFRRSTQPPTPRSLQLHFLSKRPQVDRVSTSTSSVFTVKTGTPPPQSFEDNRVSTEHLHHYNWSLDPVPVEGGMC